MKDAKKLVQHLLGAAHLHNASNQFVRTLLQKNSVNAKALQDDVQKLYENIRLRSTLVTAAEADVDAEIEFRSNKSVTDSLKGARPAEGLYAIDHRDRTGDVSWPAAPERS